MNEKEKEILKRLEDTVFEKMSGEGTGHDKFHVERVLRMSRRIMSTVEGADGFIVEAAALLHDIADHKFHDGDEEIGPATAKAMLEELGADSTKTAEVVRIVEEISFKGAGVPTPMSSLEGRIVQDADRLDAIGAIGIARTFAYGGSRGFPLYDPKVKAVCHTSFAAYKTSTNPTINHFYEKLLLLKDLMNTEEGRRIAEGRHAFMEDFLTRFYHEWDGRDG